MRREKIVLITGVNGFVGYWLARFLKEEGYRVLGLCKTQPRIDLKKYLDGFYITNLELPESVNAGVVDFDIAIHLAALTPQSAAKNKVRLESIGAMNSKIDQNFFRLLLKSNNLKRVLVVSSCAVYAESSAPLLESSPLLTDNSYKTSKLALENLACEFEKTTGVASFIARPFNHFGPRQQAGFIVPDLVEKVRASRKKPIQVGNLSTVRDYLDVRDIAKAYLKLLECESDDRIFNICSGRGISGYQIYDEVTSVLGIKPGTRQEVRADPSQPSKIVGNGSLLRRTTGWSQSLSIRHSVRDYIAMLAV